MFDAGATPHSPARSPPVSSVLIHKRHYFHLISPHYHLLFRRACLYLNYLEDFLWRFHCGAPRLHCLITGVRLQVAIDNGDVMMWNGHHSADQSTRVSNNPAATRLPPSPSSPPSLACFSSHCLSDETTRKNTHAACASLPLFLIVFSLSNHRRH